MAYWLMKKTLKTTGLECAMIEEITRTLSEVFVYFGSPEHELFTDVYSKAEAGDATGQYFYTTEEECGRNLGLDEMPSIALFRGSPEKHIAYPQDRPHGGDLSMWARSAR